MKNIEKISILFIFLSIFIGCKNNGDIRKIPAPGDQGLPEQKLFKAIAGSKYTASSLSCGSYELRDVALNISYPRRRLLERNKTATPGMTVSFNRSDLIRAEYAAGKIPLTETKDITGDTTGLMNDLKETIKEAIIPKPLPQEEKVAATPEAPPVAGTEKQPETPPQSTLPANYDPLGTQKAIANTVIKKIEKRTQINPALFKNAEVRYTASSFESEEDKQTKSIAFKAELKEDGNDPEPLKIFALMSEDKKDTLQVEFETKYGTCSGNLIAGDLRLLDTTSTISAPPLSY